MTTAAHLERRERDDGVLADRDALERLVAEDVARPQVGLELELARVRRLVVLAPQRAREPPDDHVDLGALLLVLEHVRHRLEALVLHAPAKVDHLDATRRRGESKSVAGQKGDEEETSTTTETTTTTTETTTTTASPRAGAGRCRQQVGGTTDLSSKHRRTLEQGQSFMWSRHHITFHYISLQFVTFRYISLHFVTFRYISLHSVTFHYISFRFVTFRYVSLRFVTFHDLTLYITLQGQTWNMGQSFM